MKNVLIRILVRKSKSDLAHLSIVAAYEVHFFPMCQDVEPINRSIHQT